MPNAKANAASPLAAHRFSRRSFMRGVGASLFPLAAGYSHAAGMGPLRTGKAKSVIMIFNGGAPSHLDLWDPKPDASDDVRGPFKPIRTNVTGIHISELLPRMAKRMDKVALIRSVHHGHSSHNGGMHWATVGRPYAVDSTLITPSRTDIPCFGTLIGWLARRDGYSNGVPPYVITPFPTCDSKVYLTPGQFGGCLGAHFDPYVLDDDPNGANFKVRNLGLDDSLTPVRFQERLGLLQELTVTAPKLNSPLAAEMDVFNQQAADLLHSGKAADAFDLTKEPTSVRERYGRHSWGQSHLLARRLIESGTRFVSTVNGPASRGTRTRIISTR